MNHNLRWSQIPLAGCAPGDHVYIVTDDNAGLQIEKVLVVKICNDLLYYLRLSHGKIINSQAIKTVRIDDVEKYICEI